MQGEEEKEEEKWGEDSSSTTGHLGSSSGQASVKNSMYVTSKILEKLVHNILAFMDKIELLRK